MKRKIEELEAKNCKLLKSKEEQEKKIAELEGEVLEVQQISEDVNEEMRKKIEDLETKRTKVTEDELAEFRLNLEIEMEKERNELDERLTELQEKYKKAQEELEMAQSKESDETKGEEENTLLHRKNLKRN